MLKMASLFIDGMEILEQPYSILMSSYESNSVLRLVGFESKLVPYRMSATTTTIAILPSNPRLL